MLGSRACKLVNFANCDSPKTLQEYLQNQQMLRDSTQGSSIFGSLVFSNVVIRQLRDSSFVQLG